METLAEFDGLVCISLGLTRNPSGSDYMTRVEQSLVEGGLDDDKFDLFDEEGSAFKP